MTDKPHDRRISFRVTHEDFEQILRALHARGTSSVSELARAAIQAFIRSSTYEANQTTLCTIIEDLRRTVEELKARLDTLPESIVPATGKQNMHESTNDCELGIHKG